MNQKYQILKYIQDYGSITSYEAYIDLGITQLASRLSELKEMGYKIEYEWVKKKNRYNKPIRYKRYKLEVTNENIV